MSFQLLMVRSLDRIETRLDRMDQRFERMDQRFERIDQRFEHMEQRFERIDQRFESLTRWSISTVVAVLVGAGAVIVTLILKHL